MGDKDYLEDVSGQFDAELRRIQQIETFEMAKAEAVEITLQGRLLASSGMSLQLYLSNGETLSGIAHSVTNTWLILKLQRVDVLVFYRGIEMVEGASAAPQWATLVEQRHPATAVLREMSERGVEVTFTTTKYSVSGVITRVGQNFVDFSDHGRDRAIALDSLLTVSCPRVT